MITALALSQLYTQFFNYRFKQAAEKRPSAPC